MLACPHVGAVAVHHERQIAENRHAAGACARLVPLCVGKPLQVLVEQHLAGKLPARLMDGQRVAPLQRLGPRGPRPLGFARVNRTKQRVIFDPPSLLAQEAFQCPCPFAVVAPLLGPFLDRFSHGRRWAIGTTMALRAFLVWLMAVKPF